MKKLLRLAICVVIVVLILGFGGYSLGGFGSAIHLKDPTSIFSKLPSVDVTEVFDGTFGPSQEKLDGVIDENKEKDPNSNASEFNDLFKDAPYNNPDNSSDSTSSTSTSYSNGLEDLFKNSPYTASDTDKGLTLFSSSYGNTDSDSLDTIKFAIAKTYKITYGEKVLEFSVDKTFEFVKWLHQNFSDDEDITVDIIPAEVENQPTDTTEDISATPTEEPIEDSTVKYDRVLNNVRDLNALSKTINIVDTLPKGEGYDRNTFEKPVKNYKYQYKEKSTGELVITDQKMNRNDYSWMTSKYLESLVPLKYICPYTGKVLMDLDDDKEDGDLGNLDYDHIVPLKSAYRRGADKWSDAKKNEYAYDQWVGVDVTASANRSKSDKGPLEYMPDINKEDYCYSWILICSKYGLSMTQEELDFCVNTIKDALLNGETVEHMGGSYREN